MIDKLRKKIFWIIQISLSIIILGVMIVFISSSYNNTITSSTMFMDRIEGRENEKNERPKELNEPKNNEDINSIAIDGVYKIQLKNGVITNSTSNITEDIRQLALNISNKTKEEGTSGKYIYKIRKFGNNEIEITLMENEEVIQRLKITIIYTLAIGILVIGFVGIIARKISLTIVKPVEESFEKQKQFVSDASHELKTPLAVIEANADVLEDKIGENKWITYIQNEVQSMNKLVNDLLTLAKMGSTNIINRQKFDLSKEIKMSVAVFESIIFEKKILLETNINDNIDFNGEKEDIKQIVSILIDNAIKHTEENKKIIVYLGKEKNEITIKVKNQGEEIPKEEQEKIFERFYRVDKARNRSEKRYGLGLSIAKGLVQKYKGNISVESKGGFTSFIVKLPC